VEEIISHAAQRGVLEARQEGYMLRGILVAGNKVSLGMLVMLEFVLALATYWM
jgi:hypothetical protein